MSTTDTDTMPVTEMPREQVEAELAEVRRLIANRQHAEYSDPDAIGRLGPVERTAHNMEAVRLGDTEAALLRRLGILDRRESEAEQAAAEQHHVVEDPLAVRYQAALLAQASGRPKAAAEVAAIEAEMAKLDQETRRSEALKVAQAKQTAAEAEAARKLAESEAAKLKGDAQVRVEDARRRYRALAKDLASAADEVCDLGVALNLALHDECAAEIIRAIQTNVKMPWSRRLVTSLGGGWRTAPQSRRIV